MFLLKILYILCILSIWLFPTFVAYVRRHNNFIPIFLLNLISSFTIIGYFASFIWAFTDNTSGKQKFSTSIIFLIYITILIISFYFIYKTAFFFTGLENFENIKSITVINEL